jgi:hypothetical protein
MPTVSKPARRLRASGLAAFAPFPSARQRDIPSCGTTAILRLGWISLPARGGTLQKLPGHKIFDTEIAARAFWRWAWRRDRRAWQGMKDLKLRSPINKQFRRHFLWRGGG